MSIFLAICVNMQILRTMAGLCMDQRCYAFSSLIIDKVRRSMYSVGSDVELTAAHA